MDPGKVLIVSAALLARAAIVAAANPDIDIAALASKLRVDAANAWSGKEPSVAPGAMTGRLSGLSDTELGLVGQADGLSPIEARILAALAESRLRPDVYGAIADTLQRLAELANPEVEQAGVLGAVTDESRLLLLDGLKCLVGSGHLGPGERRRFTSALQHLEQAPVRPDDGGNGKRTGNDAQVRSLAGLQRSLYRLTWEGFLLMPFGHKPDECYLRTTVALAARTLGQIGHHQSALALEQAYVWSLPRRDRLTTRSAIMEALVTMGETEHTKRQALAAAWHCFAATPAGTEKDLRLRQVKGGFAPEIIADELKRVQSGGYVQFLRMALGSRVPARQASAEEKATGDALLAMAISEMFSPRAAKGPLLAIAIKQSSMQMRSIIRRAEELNSGVVEIALLFPPEARVRTEYASLLREPLHDTGAFKEKFEEEVLSAEPRSAASPVVSFDLAGYRATVVRRARTRAPAVFTAYVMVARRMGEKR